jgi:LPPG:FO 2-phospho-L-lactate transferase
MIAVLCGGVGAARFLAALAQVVDPADTVGIVNTGDDTVLHGLVISPDLDTVTYTLADAIDPIRGWGLADESWRAMEALQRYATVRPDGSSAAPTWFNLGDRDLATHFYRTARLGEGASLTEVTAEICAAWGVRQRLVPMSNHTVSTVVSLAEGGDVSFQEYFVKLHHGVAVNAVRFAGIREAQLTPGLDEVLRFAECVVIAPSNPIVSIGPIRALDGVDAILSSRRASVVAISPIVGGAALKGPADRMLTELGHEPSVVGVARLYAPIAGTLVIDPVGAHLAGAIEAEGVRAVITPSVMSSPEIGAELARVSLAASPADSTVQPSERSPTLSSVHGAQARWIRAAGRQREREMSFGRRSTLTDRMRWGPPSSSTGRGSSADTRTDVDNRPPPLAPARTSVRPRRRHTGSRVSDGRHRGSPGSCRHAGRERTNRPPHRRAAVLDRRRC